MPTLFSPAIRLRALRRAVSVAALGLLGTATVSATASAQFRFNFVGSANIGDQPGSGGANLLINFVNPIRAVPTTTLPGITEFTSTGTINDVVINPAGCVNCPIIPFVQIGGYTFALTSTPVAPAVVPGITFGPLQLVATATGTTMSLGGFGTVTGGALTGQNYFSGVFTSQFSNETPAQVFASISNVQGNATRLVGFSAEFTTGTTPFGPLTPTVTPEPASMILLATGMVGVFGVVRRKRRDSSWA